MFRTLLLLAVLAVSAPAAVTHIDVLERSDVLDGKSFGAAGPYERIIGTARFAVDPKLPANRIITDIDLAPRNADGMVEFSADIYLLKPRDPAKGNGKWRRAVRGVQPGPEGNARHVQSLQRFARPAVGGAFRRWFPDGAGLHDLLAGVAVRCAARR
jgi:hypothetical protein